MSDEPEVRAAGGVVWRRSDDSGEVEVLLVHRPKYDDWSLPKGKLDEGEAFEAAAIREVFEETGVSGVLGADLGEVHYTDHHGRAKLVRWWAFEALRVGAPTAGADEVDQLLWVLAADVAGHLTHDTDREIVRRFLETV